MKEKKEESKLVLFSVALAIGVAITVLSFIGLSHDTLATLTGIAVMLLAVGGLNSVKK